MRLKQPNTAARGAAFLVEEDYFKKPAASGQATGVYDPRRRTDLPRVQAHSRFGDSGPGFCVLFRGEEENGE